jgi:hypothetical protein
MMEADLQALLLTACPRVYPDVAPSGAGKPWVTWQSLGGESLGFLDNTAADKRNCLMQINCWATTRMQSIQIIRDIETLMRATPAFIATPSGEASSVYENDTLLYGSIQRYEIYATR